jgi:hypothetical protein
LHFFQSCNNELSPRPIREDDYYEADYGGQIRRNFDTDYYYEDEEALESKATKVECWGKINLCFFEKK